MALKSQRVALITGCSEPGSIGAATALELHLRGWRVFATARSIETLLALREAGCDVLELDVTFRRSIDDAQTAVSKATDGRLDLLINNAGVMGTAPLLHTDPDKFKALFEVNVTGPLRMVQAFTPLLLRTTETPGNKQTKIINIGSVLSGGAPWHTAYGSSKAALQAMSDIMRREFSSLGIRVITVELGLVKSAMSAQEKQFDLTITDPSRAPNPSYYPNWVDIGNAVASYLKGETKVAPTAPETAKAMVDAVEKDRSPGKIWLGQHKFAFQFLFPYFPVRILDMVWGRIMKTEMIQRQRR